MPIKTLLVDDNPTFLAAMRQFLSLLPEIALVGEAHNGLDALTFVAQEQPDLLLLDIAMPKLNGMELARRLQHLPNRPKVIFISMHDGAAYQAAALEVGAIGLVNKSNFVAELLPMLAALVSALSPAAAP